MAEELRKPKAELPEISETTLSALSEVAPLQKDRRNWRRWHPFWESVLAREKDYPWQLVDLCRKRKDLQKIGLGFRGQSGAAPEPEPRSIARHLPGVPDQTTKIGTQTITLLKKTLGVANGADPRSIVGFHMSATGAGDSLAYAVGLWHKYFGGSAHVIDIGPFSSRIYRQVKNTGADVNRIFVERGRAVSMREALQSARQAIAEMKEKQKSAEAKLDELRKDPEKAGLINAIEQKWQESEKHMDLVDKVEEIRQGAVKAKELRDEVLASFPASGEVVLNGKRYSKEGVQRRYDAALDSLKTKIKELEDASIRDAAYSHTADDIQHFFSIAKNRDPLSASWADLADGLFKEAFNLRLVEARQLMDESEETASPKAGLGQVRRAYEKKYASSISPTYLMTDLDTGTGARNSVHAIIEKISGVFRQEKLDAPFFVIDGTSSQGVDLGRLAEHKVAVYEGTVKPYGSAQMSFISSTENGTRHLIWIHRALETLADWTHKKNPPLQSLNGWADKRQPSLRRTLVPPHYLDWYHEWDAQRTGTRGRFTQVVDLYRNVMDNILFSFKRASELEPGRILTSSEFRKHGVKAEDAMRDILARFSADVMKEVYFEPYVPKEDRSYMVSAFKQPPWFVIQEPGAQPVSLVRRALDAAEARGAVHHPGYSGADPAEWRHNIDYELAKLVEPYMGIIRINHYLPRDADLSRRMNNILMLVRRIARVMRQHPLEEHRDKVPKPAELNSTLKELKGKYLAEYAKKGKIPVKVLAPLAKMRKKQ